MVEARCRLRADACLWAVLGAVARGPAEDGRLLGEGKGNVSSPEITL